MPPRTIYEGSISVEASDYTNPVDEDDDDDSADEEIENLDDLVTRKSKLTFTLDYPFEQPFTGAVIGDGGVTLRQIIDAVRKGFRVMYRGASQEDIADLANKRVIGTYGEAMHAMSDLVIESIDLDEDSATLEIGIGS